MKRKSILLSLLLAIFVVGGMFAQEPTYSKMSPYTRILLDKLAKKDTANSLLRSSISGDYLSAFVKVATDGVSKKVFLSSFLFYIFTKIIYQRK